jgi:hypothetical protein
VDRKQIHHALYSVHHHIYRCYELLTVNVDAIFPEALCNAVQAILRHVPSVLCTYTRSAVWCLRMAAIGLNRYVLTLTACLPACTAYYGRSYPG